MVTHDPVAASYTDRIVLLVDGRVVAEMVAPTAERVFDWLKQFGE
jgi:putative ABC transport system ATP-binding protein